MNRRAIQSWLPVLLELRESGVHPIPFAYLRYLFLACIMEIDFAGGLESRRVRLFEELG